MLTRTHKYSNCFNSLRKNDCTLFYESSEPAYESAEQADELGTLGKTGNPIKTIIMMQSR